ncbi:hypothetical protein POL68_38620 [Stigmatella sp. ncwal1]|uniref:Lipoprotein n=1 Tax=Stigmatella ashevillensis TaxID=2995309 RepID=A0ABT5DL90_9BACT|nr:hypothetical protein [Stigmatella ashevillena]MDC0714434.1 hypothetical protein [Stigmatella ashevillena]
MASCTKPPPSRLPEAGLPPVRLDFRPPADRSITERAQTVRTVERGGERKTETVEMTTVTRFAPVESGWQLTQTVSRAGMSQEGAPVRTQVDEVFTRVALQVQLAADGAFVKVSNPGEALKVLRTAAPAGQGLGALEAFLSPEAVEERTRREWEAKFGGLFQRNLTVGQHTWAVDRFPTPEGEIVYLLERTVTGTRLTDQGDALVLSLRCLEALPEEASAELQEVYQGAGAPPLTPGVTCEGEQVVARGHFVPVSRTLTVRAQVAGAAWTLAAQTKLEMLEEAR